MNKMARWTHARITPAIEPTIRLALRVGARGTGQELGAVQYWSRSTRSMDEADRIAACIDLSDGCRAQQSARHPLVPATTSGGARVH